MIFVLFVAAKTITFAFDKVFNHEASQEDVFVEISQLVQSALDGYKVTLILVPKESLSGGHLIIILYIVLYSLCFMGI